jgi:uncharacterized membrane protein
MSELVVLRFPDQEGGERALAEVERAERAGEAAVADAAAVRRSRDGRLEISQIYDLPFVGALVGAVAGALVGFLFAPVWLAAIIGAVVGTVGGTILDIGISDDLITRIARHLEPGQSAVFLQLDEPLSTPTIEQLRPLYPRVWHASLSPAEAAKLDAALRHF